MSKSYPYEVLLRVKDPEGGNRDHATDAWYDLKATTAYRAGNKALAEYRVDNPGVDPKAVFVLEVKRDGSRYKGE